MPPGHPVVVVGLSDVVEAGDITQTCATLKEARQIAEGRKEQQHQQQFAGDAQRRLRDFYRDLGTEEVKELNMVLKADVWGSAEAVKASLAQLDSQLEEVDINVVYAGVGEITESDVMLAVASQALVLGFRVAVSNQVRQAAADGHVEIRTYDVIYEALDDINKAMLGMLEPVYEERFIGQAEVLELFKVSRIGVIAGCRATEGHLQHGVRIVVRRDGEQVFEGTLESLRHFAQDVSKV